MLRFQHKFVFTKIYPETHDRQGTVQKAGSKGHRRQWNKGEKWKVNALAQRWGGDTEKANSTNCQEERESTEPSGWPVAQAASNSQ